MSSRLLVGEVVDPLADDLDRLQRLTADQQNQIVDLRDALAQVKLERDTLKQATDGLRRLLAPLWGELQHIPQSATVVGTTVSGSDPRLESAKKRMPGKPAELIDLLLEHGPMTVTNIIAIARWGKNSVYQTVSKLMKAGIVVNNGGRYTLKEQ